MLRDWNLLSDDMQLALSREAMRQALETVTAHAECLAGEIDAGNLVDRGGAEALRLFVAVIAETQLQCHGRPALV